MFRPPPKSTLDRWWPAPNVYKGRDPAGAAPQLPGTGGGTPGATAQPATVATASAVEATAATTVQEQATVAPVPASSAQAMDAILAMMEPVAAEQSTAPSVTRPVAAPTPVETPDPVAVFTTTVVEDPVTPVVVPTLADNDTPVSYTHLKLPTTDLA